MKTKNDKLKIKSWSTHVTTLCATFSFYLLVFSLLLVLSTVFVVGDDLADGVVSGKYFWFYGSMGLVGLSGLISAFRNKTPFRFSLLDIFVSLFAAGVFLSALVWNDASQNMTKLTLLTLLAVLYFDIRLLLNDLNKYNRIFRDLFRFFIVITGLVEAVWGLLQLYGFESSQHGLFKTTGSFFNPGPYAGYLAVVFPLALHEILRRNEKKTRLNAGKWLSATTCIAIILVLPAAMSRAAWLAMIAGSVVVFAGRYADNTDFRGFLNTVFPKNRRRRTGIVLVALALLLCASLAGMYFLKKNSADGRFLTWKISLQTVLKHPFGVGLGNFSGAYGQEQAAYFASGIATETEELVAGSPEYGFNEYLQILIESGIVSFLLFVAVLVCAFRSMTKTKSRGRTGALTALSVFACFSYPFGVLPFLIVSIFLLAMCGSWHADDADNTDLRGFLNICVNPRRLRVIACLFLVAASFCLYKQYPVYRAYKQWKTNQMYYHSGMYKETAANYGKLYPYLNDRTQFLFEYAQSLSKSDRPEKSNEVLQRAMQISCDPMLYNIMGKNYQAMKEYERAEQCFIKSTQIVPNRLYPWYLLCKLYAETGQTNQLTKAAAIVQTKEPKVQSRAVREMREEVGKLKTKS